MLFFHRNSHVPERYTFLCNIINKTETVLKTNFNRRVEFVHLGFLIKGLYYKLSENERVEFINRYPLENNLHIWKVIGLGNLPASSRWSLDNFMSNACSLLKKMGQESFSAVDFVKMVC